MHFKYFKYCSSVGLEDCKFVGNLELKGLKEVDLDGRIEMLWLNGCTFGERQWEDFIELMVKIKRVQLDEINMEKDQWKKLVDIIENGTKEQSLKLKELKLSNCNIDAQLVERVR